MKRSRKTTGKRKHKPYKEPLTFREAETRKADLVAGIEIIEAQLSDKSRVEEGKYVGWRQRALIAKANLVRELRLIKIWERKERDRLLETVVRIEGMQNPSDPYCIIASLRKTTLEVIKENGISESVKQEQWNVIDYAERFRNFCPTKLT